jgi:hypothetical protein
MSSIKIISTPPGQAPEEVRKEWVGLVIPMPKQETGGTQRGVLGGKPQNTNGYQVDTLVALEILRGKSPDAAQWFLDNAFLGGRFAFAREACEVVP